MQIDMHYFGTYAMARSAGLTIDVASNIATAAQYVDDNTSDGVLTLIDGARLPHLATAHDVAPEQMQQMFDEENQRQVWVPFHFLPGNQGSEYTERLVCQKMGDKNPIPGGMISEAIERAKMKDPCALERIGITAHVIADTFSHQGFSGVSSRRNKVIGSSIAVIHTDIALQQHLKDKITSFFTRYGEQGGLFVNIKNWIGEVGALGHGAVGTFPDIPYLHWSFKYEMNGIPPVNRNNQSEFLEACKTLHNMFTTLAATRPDLADANACRPFHSVNGTVNNILALEHGKDRRAAEWQREAKAGNLFAMHEDIPPYQGDEWTASLAAIDKRIDSRTMMTFPVCRFHLAAHQHRSFVLHKLLPSQQNSLVVA